MLDNAVIDLVNFLSSFFLSSFHSSFLPFFLSSLLFFSTRFGDSALERLDEYKLTPMHVAVHRAQTPELIHVLLRHGSKAETLGSRFAPNAQYLSLPRVPILFPTWPAVFLVVHLKVAARGSKKK